MRPPHAPVSRAEPGEARPFAVYAAMLTGAQAIFSVQDAVVKTIGAEIGVLQYATLRAGFVLGLIAAGWAAMPRLRRPLRRRGPVIARSLFQVASILIYFAAITRMPLAVAATAFYTFPIITTLAGAVVARERVPPLVWVAAPLGFLGAAIILGPARAEVDWLIALPLLAAAAYAASVVITHHACAEEDTLALVRAQNLTFLAAGAAGLALAGAGAIPAGWGWTPMEPPVWGVLAGISALNLAMAFLLLHVYQHAAPPRLGPFSYSYLVFAAALDWAVWGAPPTATTLLGAGLTAAAGMLVLSARAGGARARGEPAE